MESEIRALAFDTGGTLLDWHGGLTAAFTRVGAQKKIDRDWPLLTNEYRRRSLGRMLNAVDPNFNIDDVNREELDRLLREENLPFDGRDTQLVLDTWHQLDAWPDVRQGLLRLREKYLVVPLTILSISLIIHAARKNGMVWDAVLSCEFFGNYKFNPEPYRLAAEKLALDPSQIMMVACHNLDLAAARSVGYHSAYIRRPREWGPEAPPDHGPDRAVDIVASDLSDLADQLGVPSIGTERFPA